MPSSFWWKSAPPGAFVSNILAEPLQLPARGEKDRPGRITGIVKLTSSPDRQTTQRHIRTIVLTAHPSASPAGGPMAPATRPVFLPSIISEPSIWFILPLKWPCLMATDDLTQIVATNMLCEGKRNIMPKLLWTLEENHVSSQPRKVPVPYPNSPSH